VDCNCGRKRHVCGIWWAGDGTVSGGDGRDGEARGYVGDLMQEELPGWFDRMLRVIESSALFVWFMRRRFRGLKARRWVEGWIRGHYPDEDVQILDCDVRTGRATICVDGGHVIM